MDRNTAPAPDACALLDAALGAFVQGGVSIGVASRDAALRPHAVRAIGCRPAGARLVVFVPAAQGRAVLDDVAASGRVAVVFSQPSTHRTCQLKGIDARIEPLRAGDRELARHYGAAFAGELVPIGFPAALVEALLDGADDLVGVSFTPEAAFDGTPGPRSGTPLEASR